MKKSLNTFQKILLVLLIFLIIGAIYLILPKYYFVVSERSGYEVPIFRCNKITGSCKTTAIGGRLIEIEAEEKN